MRALTFLSDPEVQVSRTAQSLTHVILITPTSMTADRWPSPRPVVLTDRWPNPRRVVQADRWPTPRLVLTADRWPQPRLAA